MSHAVHTCAKCGEPLPAFAGRILNCTCGDRDDSTPMITNDASLGTPQERANAQEATKVATNGTAQLVLTLNAATGDEPHPGNTPKSAVGSGASDIAERMSAKSRDRANCAAQSETSETRLRPDRSETPIPTSASQRTTSDAAQRARSENARSENGGAANSRTRARNSRRLVSDRLPRDPFERDEPYGDQLVRRGILLGRALLELRDLVEPGGDEAADGLIAALNALSLGDCRAILLAWALTAPVLPDSIDDGDDDE